MSAAEKSFPLFNAQEPRIRILHFTWLAFFITFLVWFAHVSLMPFIKAELALTDAQVKAFLILNVSLTIPARILIGILVDKYGPRLSYSLLLALSGALCIGFAAAQTFEQLAVMRFLLGLAGAASWSASAWSANGSRRARAGWRRASMPAGAISAPPSPRWAFRWWR